MDRIHFHKTGNPCKPNCQLWTSDVVAVLLLGVIVIFSVAIRLFK